MKLPTKHKHAEVIKAWAEGAEIEWRYPGRSQWVSNGSPSWDTLIEYRVKPKTVLWEKERLAFAAGQPIQYRQWCTDPEHPWDEAKKGPWMDWDFKDGNRFTHEPRWDSAPWLEYRIKPISHLHACATDAGLSWSLDKRPTSNLKMTFVEGKLMKAEVLT